MQKPMISAIEIYCFIIGGMNTRGYGRIRCEDGNTRMPPLEDRLASFNDHIKELWQDMKRISSNSLAIPEEPEAIYFSLDLLAPGIFRDENGLPSLAPNTGYAGPSLETRLLDYPSRFRGGLVWGLGSAERDISCGKNGQ